MCLLLLIDSITCQLLFLCWKPIIGQQGINFFFTRVWVHFGLPNFIISSRDSRFLSRFSFSLNIDCSQAKEKYCLLTVHGCKLEINTLVVRL